jgi:hypothetical protein
MTWIPLLRTISERFADVVELTMAIEEEFDIPKQTKRCCISS